MLDTIPSIGFRKSGEKLNFFQRTTLGRRGLTHKIKFLYMEQRGCSKDCPLKTARRLVDKKRVQEVGLVRNDKYTPCLKYGEKCNIKGYAQFRARDLPNNSQPFLNLGVSRMRGGHRVAYELFYGLSIKYTIDHLCRNRWCVNGAHLEDVPLWENLKRVVIRSNQ